MLLFLIKEISTIKKSFFRKLGRHIDVTLFRCLKDVFEKCINTVSANWKEDCLSSIMTLYSFSTTERQNASGAGRKHLKKYLFM